MSWPKKSGGMHIGGGGVREGLGSPVRVGVVGLSKVTPFKYLMQAATPWSFGVAINDTLC